MKPIDLGNCVYLYENTFTPGNFIELLEEECKNDWGYLSWFRTLVGSGDNLRADNYRSSLGCELSPLNVPESEVSVDRLLPVRSAWDKIRTDTDKAVWHYRNEHVLNLTKDEGYRVLKYGRGAEYRGHVDHHPSNQRVLSVLGYLNDGYAGGELVFPLLDITVKPKAGAVLLFPSNFPYYHYANSVGDVSDEIKYSFVSWFV